MWGAPLSSDLQYKLGSFENIETLCGLDSNGVLIDASNIHPALELRSDRFPHSSQTLAFDTSLRIAGKQNVRQTYIELW